MIPEKLTDYVGIYPNWVNHKLCKSACANLSKNNWEKHHYFNPISKEHLTFEDDLLISYEKIPEKEEIQYRLWLVIHQYVMKDMVFCEKWFNGWSEQSSVRFNRYDKNTLMRIHCDHIHTLFDGKRRGIPILSALAVLNDNYTGGEFVMFGDQQVHLPTGSVIVFPSNFLFPHEVKPIKKGVRYSCVSWAW